MAAHLATVYQVSPLMITEDGAQSPVAAIKLATYSAPAMGDRVLVDQIRPTFAGGTASLFVVYGKIG